jgi:hypothetical protein
MAIHKTDLGLFPEEYLLEEDEMGESNAQFQLIRYLVSVLEWLFHIEKWQIAGNLEFYHPAVKNSQNKITPDICVFKGVFLSPYDKQTLSSWDIVPDQDEMPPVVFEISSRSTWRSDIQNGENNKPAIYGRMSFKEYFAYDPNEPPVWKAKRGRRLLGWRYENGQPVEIASDGSGRLWSNELNSWLVPDGPILRLYDRENTMRLTEKEVQEKQSRAKDLTIEIMGTTIQTMNSTMESMNQRMAEMERQLRELQGEKDQA